MFHMVENTIVLPSHYRPFHGKGNPVKIAVNLGQGVHYFYINL